MSRTRSWLASCLYTSLVTIPGAEYCMPMHDTEHAHNLRVELHLPFRLQWPWSAAALYYAGWCTTLLCVCVEFCTSHHPCAVQIDRGTRLEPHSFEPGQPDSNETALSHSDGFKAVWTALKQVWLLLNPSGQFCVSLTYYVPEWCTTINWSRKDIATQCMCENGIP